MRFTTIGMFVFYLPLFCLQAEVCTRLFLSCSSFTFTSITDRPKDKGNNHRGIKGNLRMTRLTCVLSYTIVHYSIMITLEYYSARALYSILCTIILL